MHGPDVPQEGGCFHSRTAVGMYDHVRKAVDDGDVLLEWDYSKVMNQFITPSVH